MCPLVVDGGEAFPASYLATENHKTTTNGGFATILMVDSKSTLSPRLFPQGFALLLLLRNVTYNDIFLQQATVVGNVKIALVEVTKQVEDVEPHS